MTKESLFLHMIEKKLAAKGHTLREASVIMGKPPHSLSQMFRKGNPEMKYLIEIETAFGFKLIHWGKLTGNERTFKNLLEDLLFKNGYDSQEGSLKIGKNKTYLAQMFLKETQPRLTTLKGIEDGLGFKIINWSGK